ncbi:Low molecular weight phosphotyrosine protein phosphatase, putative [Leishmania lindenbergi]|uniref:Low molecular weight phosphotyrosine protein phosphatase n=1 Tax=Leishmania lindenbergi TaxID=651832 RepID=A0AAW3AYU0_9TRYP
MSSCRGVLVAGVTNRARTQMAEAFLRAFTGGSVFVCSGGVHHLGTVHPLAVATMAEVGINVSQQSSSSLAGACRQRGTYDVYVSVDAPYTERTSDYYQRRYTDTQAAQQSMIGGTGLSASFSSSTLTFSDPLLALPVPAHWTVAHDTADGRQSWTLWSPRDPAIYHERSTRKLQDHLYEGEPLFMRVQPHELRKACRVQRRWEVPALAHRFALETEAEQKARFRRARDLLGSLALALVRDLEREYGETMLDEATVAAYEKAAATGC